MSAKKALLRPDAARLFVLSLAASSLCRVPEHSNKVTTGAQCYKAVPNGV